MRSVATPPSQPEAPARADQCNNVYPRRSLSGGAAHGCIEWRDAIPHLSRVAIFPVCSSAWSCLHCRECLRCVRPSLALRVVMPRRDGDWCGENIFKGCLGAAERQDSLARGAEYQDFIRCPKIVATSCCPTRLRFSSYSRIPVLGSPAMNEGGLNTGADGNSPIQSGSSKPKCCKPRTPISFPPTSGLSPTAPSRTIASSVAGNCMPSIAVPTIAMSLPGLMPNPTRCVCNSKPGDVGDTEPIVDAAPGRQQVDP